MADERVVSDIVTKFLLNTCRLCPQLTTHAVQAAIRCSELATQRWKGNDAETDFIPQTSGSIAEFYIEPMLPLVGDVDVMCYQGTWLTITRGHPPPTQLPAEFRNYVKVFEIIDSHLPGYVYLELRYLLTKYTDNDKYNYFETEHGLYLTNPTDGINKKRIHGPALLKDLSKASLLSLDAVPCIRCLSWPPQAADWPTRHRHYDWPDSATVGHVVSNGCDVVGAVHRQCRQDEWMSKHQWRLSFSRAEIVLLNSWMPVQQIVYHMLRFFMKTKRFTGSDAGEALSNYHIKTFMMWACELKSSSFWTDDLNLVRVCVELLHGLSVCLSAVQCKHYFISSHNLIDNILGAELTASLLMSIDQQWLSTWFLHNYIQKCSMLCLENVSSLFNDISTDTKLQSAVSAVVDWRIELLTALEEMWIVLQFAQPSILAAVSIHSLTAQSCVCWLRELAKTHTCLPLYFTAVAFLDVACKLSRNGFTDKLMDVLLALVGQLVSTRRHASQCSSELSLRKATKLMKIVANSSHGTVRLIATELSIANDLNTSELVKLLQWSAVEHLTTFRHLMTQDFVSDVATVVTTDFEALYTYKYGSHQQCLQLSMQNVHMLLYAVRMPELPILYPAFTQLLDDDIVSLTAVTLIVNPECRDYGRTSCISQLTLSLYLMTQCQLKLRHSVTSLAETLDYIELTQRSLPVPAKWTLNQLTLQLTKHKVLMYIQQSLM